MEGSPTTTIPPPLLLRNLLASLFIYLDKSLLTISQNHKLLHLLRHFLLSAFLFFLRLLPSLNHPSPPKNHDSPLKHPESENYAPNPAGDSGIARALNQLLAIVNDVPVSSRKYEVVRSLAEKVLDDNLREGSAVLREVNRGALSAAFGRTLNQLDAVVAEQRSYGGDGWEGGDFVGMKKMKGNRVMKAVRFCGDVAWNRFGKGRRVVNRCGGSAEKLAAEVLWLGQKMAACGCVEEAVGKWASATHLAWLSLSAEPRLQGSFVKVSAFLFEQAKDLGTEKDGEIKKQQHHRKTKMKLLLSWLPLLCRASNGTDAPVLSVRERSELERVLEETIEMLEPEEEQEQVLSLWLHHFTHCPSSDWPNLHNCYTRWCNDSRRHFLLQ